MCRKIAYINIITQTLQTVRFCVFSTKYMSGHSDSMAGVLTARSEKIFSELLVHRAHSGTNIVSEMEDQEEGREKCIDINSAIVFNKMSISI